MNTTRSMVTRRHFFRIGTGVLLGATLYVGGRTAQAQTLPKVEESDPAAKALGYLHDSTKIDNTKFPKHQASQLCSNCNFFVGKAGDAWGGCPLLAGKGVNAKGWCSAWAKKG